MLRRTTLKMMTLNFNIIIIVSSLLLSCAASEDHTNFYIRYDGDPRITLTTDEAFTSHVESFQELVNEDVSYIPINFKELGPSKDPTRIILGRCYRYIQYPSFSTIKEIGINRDWWELATYTEREILIFHELGHCHLNRSHNNRILGIYKDREVKYSIMHSDILNAYDYLMFITHYREELLNGR